MKPSDVGISPEIAREMYLFFLRTTAPRIAAERKAEQERKDGSAFENK